MKKLVLSALFAVVLCSLAIAQKPAAKKSYSEITQNLERIDGFIPIYYDDKKDKVYFEITRLEEEFLYQVSLTTGVGSNPIGLDRGQLGSTKVVSFKKAGAKLLMEQPNYDFRALSDNPAERKAVEESFAKSVIWGFSILASEGDKYLVDATSLLLRDAHGVASRLNRMKLGSYSFDKSRSAFYKPSIKGFLKNTEVETVVTVSSKGPTRGFINRTAPSGNAVTTRQRHSFVELPDSDYKPRKADPRVGFFGISFYDYGTAINEKLEKRWISRHRLKRKFTNTPTSEAVEPIVYYVDNGTPPAIRNALIDGASWWNQAFEAAGFENAFQVKVLPPDADPMDIRYNVINWVHRSTRGWAYGSSVTDPRTGEIIKGVVTLDSQRARQDFLIAGSLAPQYSGNACMFSAMPPIDYLPQTSADATALSYARIRQLSAHEIGHTLGLSHNFAASTYGRASVMDYPAPMIGIKDGKLDYSNAYDVGIGAYDKFAVKYGYSDFAPGADEDSELEKILKQGAANAILFISDPDTRPDSAIHPLANLWDNGTDPVAYLEEVMKVRRIGLDTLGVNNLEEGDAYSDLEKRLLPLFLHHRYQMRAASRSIGGVYFTYAVRDGNGSSPKRIMDIVSPEKQNLAIDALLKTIEPNELMVPENVLNVIPPMAFWTGSERTELMDGNTGRFFDPVSAAEIASMLTIMELLEPARAARMETFHARDSKHPGFQGLVRRLVDTTWIAPVDSDPYKRLIQRTVQTVVVEALMDLASNDRAASNVRRIAAAHLQRLALQLPTGDPAKFDNDPDTAIHQSETKKEIERFLARPMSPRKRTRKPNDPPSDPIGGSMDN